MSPIARARALTRTRTHADDPLHSYKSKRNFALTPEPEGHGLPGVEQWRL